MLKPTTTSTMTVDTNFNLESKGSVLAVENFNIQLIIRGSILVILSTVMTLCIIGYYLVYETPALGNNDLFLIAISYATFALATVCVYQFYKLQKAYVLVYFAAVLLTVSWITMALIVDEVWSQPSHAKRILLVGFFIFLFGWFPQIVILCCTVPCFVLSYWYIQQHIGSMTIIDQTLSIIKFPVFILIFFFTVRKLLISAQKQYLDNALLIRQLKASLRTDELTGINNRKSFNQDLPNAIDTAKRLQTTMSLIILDIDFFKLYNDNLGHPQGDKCLIQVAQILNQHCQRAVDSIARIGGEEFAFILTGSNEAQACACIDKLNRKLLESAILHPNSEVSPNVTLSSGIAEFKVSDTPDTLYQRADKALYDAKRNGRNRYACAK